MTIAADKLSHWDNCVLEFATYCKALEDPYLHQTIASYAVEWVGESGVNAGRKLLGCKCNEHTVRVFCNAAINKIAYLDRSEYWRGVNRKEWGKGHSEGFRSYNHFYAATQYIPDDATDSWQKGFVVGWNKK
jgi:hypothetical protein